MKVSLAAVLESAPAQRKAIVAGLKKAGLKVSAAGKVTALSKEQLVVLGPSTKPSPKLVTEIRTQLPQCLVWAAAPKSLAAGSADSVLPLPVSARDTRARLDDLQRKPAGSVGNPTAGEAMVDALTGFYTFNHFKEVLYIEVKRARRYGFPLAVAMIGFDALPRSTPQMRASLMSGLALVIRRSRRDTDYPVQFAKDRVMVLMPHTDLAGSLIVARRMVERVAKASVQEREASLQATVSIGVAATEPGRNDEFSELIRQAQAGLDSAQNQGGNRVEFFDWSSQGAVRVGDGIPRIPPVRP